MEKYNEIQSKNKMDLIEKLEIIHPPQSWKERNVLDFSPVFSVTLAV